ncbi:hypothetical protein [Chryseobacterium koreense]|uniref:hypothetical protein n=1 Tax=Chryseobacterium koreense TaxID=232216 RepID=UPI00065B0076|nr:hypothetical protein [Chryseobacterium koreense]MBB5333419.1 cytochrome c556 [Chryseobacterium koreense]
MKYLVLIASTILLSCNQKNNDIKHLQTQIDSLQANAYQPGFGDFMSGVQVHHNKLWFAGKNENWKLADFEIHEIKESMDDIKKFCKDRPETKSIGMIDVPLENLKTAIQKQNTKDFEDQYLILTNTCNSCHQETKHGFNVITVPTAPPFSNQNFKPQNGN